jgi:hypothetical protein
MPTSLALRALLATLVIATGARLAHADDVVGSYEVKFEQVSHNCEHPLAYPLHGALKLELKGSELVVDIERTPLMVGKLAKNGKLSAASPRPGHTPVEGMDGTFSVAGRVSPEGLLTMVMVGEYLASGKPLCTQTWNLSGTRAPPEAAAPAKDKPVKDKPKK